MPGPDQPFCSPGGEQDPRWDNPPAPVDPQAPVDYPEYLPPFPPPPPPYGYPPPYPGPAGYPGYPGYGYSDPYDPYRAAPSTGTNQLAITSLVASIVGFPLLFLCYIGVGCWIAGIVLGAVALTQIKHTNQQGRGLAIAGIAVGAVALLLALMGAIVFFARFTTTV